MTMPASLNRRRIHVRISSSLTSVTSSTVEAMDSTASETGTRTPMPSAMVVLGASTGRRSRHEMNMDGAASAHTAITRV